ncbi:unnamed protein product [Agarophyton chilense]
MQNNKNFTRARSRKNLSTSWSKAIGSAAPFLGVIALLCVTGIYYNAIRSHNVELSFDQLSAFERQLTTIGNRSIYFRDALRADDMLNTLQRHEWAKVASNVDFVAFVYDEMYRLMSEAWLQQVDKVLKESKVEGYGIVLFSCGCIIPNLIFMETEMRFDGYECMMLPGFVMSHDFVHFRDIPVRRKRCRKRDAVMKANWYEDNGWKVEEARREHEELRMKIMMQNGAYEA